MSPFLLALHLLSSSVDAAEYRPFAAQLGLGSRYGLAGAAVTWRPHELAGVVAGFGTWGPAVGGRYYFSQIAYGQLGVSPLFGTQDGSTVFYGPDITAGIDLRRKVFSFTGGLGLGVVPVGGDIRTPVTIDLGIGANFGKKRGSS